MCAEYIDINRQLTSECMGRDGINSNKRGGEKPVIFIIYKVGTTCHTSPPPKQLHLDPKNAKKYEPNC
ncbi:hypothetical protein J6590_076786, partial [Homalodisca vitripennis]